MRGDSTLSSSPSTRHSGTQELVEDSAAWGGGGVEAAHHLCSTHQPFCSAVPQGETAQVTHQVSTLLRTASHPSTFLTSYHESSDFNRRLPSFSVGFAFLFPSHASLPRRRHALRPVMDTRPGWCLQRAFACAPRGGSGNGVASD